MATPHIAAHVHQDTSTTGKHLAVTRPYAGFFSRFVNIVLDNNGPPWPAHCRDNYVRTRVQRRIIRQRHGSQAWFQMCNS